jgi:alanyl-tRNA synthetase
MSLSQDIRQRFLKYFQNKAHTLIPSGSVIPHNDPSLLFANAGMNQFKDVFLGKNKRDYNRATSCQKCIRVIDIDNVGHTSRHLTFFEMLGNFSFGDYFKKEAIDFAWDVSLNVFDIDPEKLWVSVYKDDDEAYAYWEKYLPSKRIVRFGKEENFWEMGKTGPCGPCSELLYDRGEKYSAAKTPYEDLTGERYPEFWNLVFMEYSKDEDGEITPLPKKSIDTGAGLERLIAWKMGVDCIFQTDILRSLIAEVENLSKEKYDTDNSRTSSSFEVIADHIRTLAFAISDGVIPSNTDRGYVLRKVLRRASRYGKDIGLKKPFLAKIIPRLISIMGEAYPNLISSKNRIEEVLTIEEESFLHTLQKGGNILHQIISKSKNLISGEDAFKLKDTYGFPIEEILLIAKDEHLKVDLPKFHDLEEQAKQKSRQSMKMHSEKFHENFFCDFAKTHSASKFCGYEETQTTSHVIAIVVNKRFVDEIKEGESGIIILDKTPFYAEMGGQVGDKGTLEYKGSKFLVNDCQSPYTGVIIHTGKVINGSLHKQDAVTAKINETLRQNICNNHSSTHILHWALNQILDDNINQTGSYVDDKRLRFDFNHHKALTKNELRLIEELINEKIREDLPVKTFSLTYQEAQKDPSIKQIFGEKYSEKVRVIDITFSKELCGGTHTSQLGKIGLFKIIKESSIAAGTRRIEATTGKNAEKFIQQQEDLIDQISSDLKTSPQKLKDRVISLIEENKLSQQKIKQIRKEQLNLVYEQFLKKAIKIKDFYYLSEISNLTSHEMIVLSEKFLDNLKSSIIVLANKNPCIIFIKISPDLVSKGFYANDIIKSISPIIKGGGGGKKDSAQAGGKESEKIEEALQTIRHLIEEKC